MNIEETRAFWKVASTFPPDKEAVYPAHAAAHNFDGLAFGDNCLEYGCGGGGDACSIARRAGQVCATDVVPENVSLTNTRLLHADTQNFTVRLLQASAPLPFGDGVFDRVNCHGVLHHIPEETMHEVIAEFYRVLKPGGCLYAMLYTEHLFNRCQSQFDPGLPVDRAFSAMTDGGGIARAYTNAEGRALFEGHGFKITKTVEYNEGDFRVFWAVRP
jgi:SAM-dependent methyltransferase